MRLFVLSLLPLCSFALECYDGYRLLATGSVGTTTTQCSGWNDYCYNMTASAGFIIDAVKGGCSTWRCMLARDRCIGTTFQGVPVSLCCCSGDRCNIGANSGGSSGGGWGSNTNSGGGHGGNNNNNGGWNNGGNGNNNNNNGNQGGWGSGSNNNNNNNNRNGGGWGSDSNNNNNGGENNGGSSGGWGSEGSTGSSGGSGGASGGWGSETATEKKQQIAEAFRSRGSIDDAPNRGKRFAVPEE
ncbi:hypothetical protein PFISCL1PPCAC_19100 [Pristionchus fissidentatus]|uniref:Uncharacterized protein n=1 Tax=Pristionchus fissidentatus TaxID=1538716 RepID=A0AAV5WAT2_9BILA|nr:hypothetical protein PFISCL1PPCAC_19100 [Pristionchus fissidentatus]